MVVWYKGKVKKNREVWLIYVKWWLNWLFRNMISAIGGQRNVISQNQTSQSMSKLPNRYAYWCRFHSKKPAKVSIELTYQYTYWCDWHKPAKVLIHLTYQYTYWHYPWYPWTNYKWMLTYIAVVLCPVLTTTLCLDRVGRASTPLSTITTLIKSSIICVSSSHTLYSHFIMEQTFNINICKWLSRLFQLIISS